MATTIYIDDQSIDAELTMQEGGPVECMDGTIGFSFITTPCEIGVEIIFSEEILRNMLNEIISDFGETEDSETLGY